MAEPTARDKIRAKILGSQRGLRSVLVDLDGIGIEVREPTRAHRKRLAAKSGIKAGEADDAKSMDFLTAMLFECSFVPGTQELVFEAGDKDAIDNMPVDGAFDKLGLEALKVLGVDVKALEKNSSTTRNDSSPSESQKQ